MIDAVAAIGDASDIGCWSGIPYHFLRAAQRRGWSTQPWRLNIGEFSWGRRLWNLRQMAFFRGIGGYQYSRSFLAAAEERCIAQLSSKWVLSFHHHFPRASAVHKAGAKIVYFLDATLAAQLDGHAIEIKLGKETAKRALEIERENLARADHVVTMSRWLRDYLVQKGAVTENRLSVILPGANIDLPELSRFVGDRDREPHQPFIFGVVGNDWERKGLRFLIAVVHELKRRGIAARIHVIGRCPKSVDPATTDVLGPIDKKTSLERFVGALTGCDVGCLFSKKEAFGISVLEFLRVGVPVAGFAYEGPADSIPPDAGFRFRRGATVVEVADAFGDYITNFERQREMRRAAAMWSRYVTWDRCLDEMEERLRTGNVTNPLQPWAGLKRFHNFSSPNDQPIRVNSRS